MTGLTWKDRVHRPLSPTPILLPSSRIASIGFFRGRSNNHAPLNPLSHLLPSPPPSSNPPRVLRRYIFRRVRQRILRLTAIYSIDRSIDFIRQLFDPIPLPLYTFQTDEFRNAHDQCNLIDRSILSYRGIEFFRSNFDENTKIGRRSKGGEKTGDLSLSITRCFRGGSPT